MIKRKIKTISAYSRMTAYKVENEKKKKEKKKKRD